MKNYIDLHMHSLYSDDGQYSPEQLVEIGIQNNCKIMAIADHNSVKGVAAGIAAAKEAGIKMIPAVEIDCTYKDVNLHVLGYGIDYTHDDFEQLEDNVLKQELAASAKKMDLTNQLGFDVDEKKLQELSANGVYTGEMFAEVLLEDERYDDHPLLMDYRQGKTRGDNPFVNFYWDFYAQGKPCYTKIVYPTLEETIALIKRHGGVAVLAHPGNNLKGRYGLFDEMIDLGIDGVEAFSSYHDIDTVNYFYDLAQSHGLLVTCGSDFHGKTKPAINMGQSQCAIDQEPIEAKLKEMGLLG
ncbi:MAG: PHP domain-containing protein [Erysipelotrichaceae bacterium]|nr:PHP domain-containing protein [Erysipelotrichaceae bacterium]